ncbi:MAG: cysteine--tRNA ligase [Bacteroidales bacterium]|nr:cysteine--tRNA ligase [Bacteroidales bacterium]
MANQLYIYNTLSRSKEEFKAINAPHVGLYICGPTVYSHPHLGHARMAIVFDIVYRYLQYLGYKVRFVRNVTDVGHLEDEVACAGEDKIAKKAKLEQLEPMEVVQMYLNSYRRCMRELNVLDPSIEPQASGHIIEQQLMIEQILEKGYAYEVNGSVYFDVIKYNDDHKYGILSNRKVDELLENTRDLAGQDDKKSSLDFALWKKASPEHIMRWPSKWSDGFPGWHLECSAMGTKYLGETFDIHGGGMDLMFPHHECEIAQSVAANGVSHVKYWVHNNMITINGQKMARSLNNFITLDEMFTGDNELLEQAYNPMTVRFFMLMAHYRSTLDFSNEALQAAEKGLSRLMGALSTLDQIQPSKESTVDFSEIKNKCLEALSDDFNTPIAIANLFDGVKQINNLKEKRESISQGDLDDIKSFYHTIVFDVLGLSASESNSDNGSDLSSQTIEMLLNIRLDAKKNKNFALSDTIRDQLNKIGVTIKDTKDGFEWEVE